MSWPIVRLQSISALGPQYGANVRAIPPAGAGVRYVRITDINELGQLRPDGLSEPEGENLDDYLLDDGDLLLARSGATVGKSYRHVEANGRCVFAGYLIRFRPNPAVVDSRYLSYFLQTPTYWNWVQSKKRVAAQPNINGAEYASLGVPLPPLSEQHRIVDILHEADCLRKLRREADAKAARILPALFLKMFGDPMTNLKRWPLRTFEDVCDSRLGKMLDEKQQTGKHRRPYIRNANVQWNRLDLESVFEMDFDPAEREELRLRNGDLLICEGGEVGRCAIWRDELPDCYFQKALHRARPKPRASTAEYLLHLLWALSQRGGLREATSQVTIAHLTGVKLKQMVIPVPPFELQERFSELVQGLAPIDALRRQCGKRINDLWETTLYRAFSGQLTAKWRSAHMKELRAEMELQAKLLNLPQPSIERLALEA